MDTATDTVIEAPPDVSPVRNRGAQTATVEVPALAIDPHSLEALLLRHPAWSVAAILLIAFNLRPAITTVALLWISVLTMAPVVCLGLFAPIVPPLTRRFGAEAVVLGSLLGISLGCGIRTFGVIGLYAGTVVIGASMCLLGVLAPVIVKRDFPHRIGLMMGLYTMLVCVGPAVATATAVPLQRAIGGSWQLVLLFWGLPALVGAIVFIPQLFRYDRPRGVAAPHVRGLMRDPLAWQVTFYFALVSSLAYAVFNWGPSMLQARGLDAAGTGLVMSICFVAQMVTGLLAPIIAGRQRDQRVITAVMALMTLAGLLGFVFAPRWSLTAFSIVLGLGQGGAFGIALLLFVVRAGDQHTAAKLSALAQSVGYVIGAVVGPFAVGVMYAWTGSWPIVSVFYTVISLTCLAVGVGASRARTVKVEHAQA
jgi:CP family cyanate transporter-like MFS transporter